jgi:pimeloyl-ACP methyl ester carboxylesterase
MLLNPRGELRMSAYTPIIDDHVVLSDGRKLRYAEWGDPSGQPIFLFHGAPASRLFAPDPAVTAEAGVRMVTVDRPGYGGSDPMPGRQILDWPHDVVALAEALGLDQFDVAAHSSGGPYALACGHELLDRVGRVVLISCIAPQEALHPDGFEGDDEDLTLTRRAREDPLGAAAALAGSIGWLAETPERFLDLPRPQPDVLVLQDQAIRDMFLETIREAVRQGVDAYAWDVVLERRSWGFDLSAVAASVTIFQGDLDQAVAPAEANVLARELPNAQLTSYPGAGHGLILAEWAAIMNESGVIG